MHIFSLVLIVIGILATLYAFFGALFAARNKNPIDCLPMKIYKWSYRSGLIVAIIGLFLLIIF